MDLVWLLLLIFLILTVLGTMLYRWHRKRKGIPPEPRDASDVAWAVLDNRLFVTDVAETIGEAATAAKEIIKP